MKRLKVGFFIFFIFFIFGCAVAEKKMETAKLRVNEKGRTHNFDYYFDPEKGIAVAQGGFMIDGKEYPGKILYFRDKSVLFRPNPNQCIIFPKNYVIYGFMPPMAVMNNDYDDSLFNISVSKYSVSKSSGSRFPAVYSAFSFENLQKSAVEISEIKSRAYKESYFEIPSNTECKNHEELIKI